MIAEKKQDAWIQVIDESINSDVSRKMQLYLQCAPDNFSAGIIDIGRNKFVALFDFKFQNFANVNDQCEKILSLIENNKPYLDNFYDRIVLSFDGFKNTIVPDAFFDDSHAETLFKANHTVEACEKICIDNLRMVQAKNIYAVPTVLFEFFSSYYSNIVIQHAATPFIEGILAQHKNVDETIITINVQQTFFELVATNGKNLLFCNQFKFQTSEDFIYYLLFVLEQLKLNPETQDVYLAGMIEKNSGLFAMAHKYIRHINFVKRPDFCDYSYGFEDIPRHFHFSLYNQFLCV